MAAGGSFGVAVKAAIVNGARRKPAPAGAVG